MVEMVEFWFVVVLRILDEGIRGVGSVCLEWERFDWEVVLFLWKWLGKIGVLGVIGWWLWILVEVLGGVSCNI